MGNNEARTPDTLHSAASFDEMSPEEYKEYIAQKILENAQTEADNAEACREKRFQDVREIPHVFNNHRVDPQMDNNHKEHCEAEVVSVATRIQAGEIMTVEKIVTEQYEKDPSDNDSTTSIDELLWDEKDKGNIKEWKGSLIDDYADPNQEQPSHMDPDD